MYYVKRKWWHDLMVLLRKVLLRYLIRSKVLRVLSKSKAYIGSAPFIWEAVDYQNGLSCSYSSQVIGLVLILTVRPAFYDL